MCLTMYGPEDRIKVNELRRMGHVLVAGYKVLRRHKGKIYSKIYSEYKWETGWNVSRNRHDKPMKSKQFKRGMNVCEKLSEFGAGIYVYCDLEMAKENVRWVGGYIQKVWFYADEVRGASVDRNGNGTVIVNRVKINRLAKVPGTMDKFS